MRRDRGNEYFLKTPNNRYTTHIYIRYKQYCTKLITYEFDITTWIDNRQNQYERHFVNYKIIYYNVLTRRIVSFLSGMVQIKITNIQIKIFNFWLIILIRVDSNEEITRIGSILSETMNLQNVLKNRKFLNLQYVRFY